MQQQHTTMVKMTKKNKNSCAIPRAFYFLGPNYDIVDSFVNFRAVKFIFHMLLTFPFQSLWNNSTQLNTLFIMKDRGIDG